MVVVRFVFLFFFHQFALAASQVNESEDGPFGRIGASRPKATSPPADIVESASSASTPSLFTNHYQMKTNPRGHFLLINNKDFLPGSTMENYPRNGTDLDAAAMENLFEELGYIVSSHKNVTCFEMKRLVKKMANMNHSQYSAAACCFLSHGKEGVLYGTDGEIEIRDLTVYFGENKTLVGKPKMFFFQACQGELTCILKVIWVVFRNYNHHWLQRNRRQITAILELFDWFEIRASRSLLVQS